MSDLVKDDSAKRKGRPRQTVEEAFGGLQSDLEGNDLTAELAKLALKIENERAAVQEYLTCNPGQITILLTLVLTESGRPRMSDHAIVIRNFMDSCKWIEYDRSRDTFILKEQSES